MNERAEHERWFHAVYEQHASYVRTFVQRLGTAPDEVDDAVQDVFIVVHRRCAGIDDSDEVKRLLRAISVRVCQNRRRSRWRNSLRWTQRGAWVDPDTTASLTTRPPEEEAARNQAQEAALRAIRRLKHEHREVLLLCVVLQLPASEVAGLVHASRHAVAYRLKAARRQLSRELTRLPVAREVVRTFFLANTKELSGRRSARFCHEPRRARQNR